MKPQMMHDMETPGEAWARVRGALRTQLGDDAFQNWIDPLVFVGAEHGVVHLDGADQLHRHLGAAQLRRHHPRAAVQGGRRGQPPRVRRRPRRARPRLHPPAPVAGGAAAGPAAATRRPPATSSCRPRRSTGAAPSTTSSSASRTSSPTPPPAGWPRASPSAAGQLQPAVPLRRRRPRQDPPDARDRLGGAAAATPRRASLYLSAEQFMYRFVSALRFKDMHGFKEMFRSVDMLMVDDVQFISGKDFDPGGVLPHLQRAGRAAEADRHLRRPRARARSTGSRSASSRGCSGASSSTCTRPTTSSASASCRPRPRRSSRRIPASASGRA